MITVAIVWALVVVLFRTGHGSAAAEGRESTSQFLS